MEKKKISLHLNSQAILDRTFNGSTPGYNALEVDEFLDKIIGDYKLVEANFLANEKFINDLLLEIQNLRKKNESLDIENNSLKSKISGISDVSKVNVSNIELVKRINILEKTLWKLGVNPTNIK